MMIERAFAEGRRRTGEVERAELTRPITPYRGPNDLHDARSDPFVGLPEFGCEGGNIRPWAQQRPQAFANQVRLERWQVPLQIDYEIGSAACVEFLQFSVHAIRAGRMIRTRQNSLPAYITNSGSDVLRACRDNNAADIGRPRTLPDADDHRLAVDVRHRLAGKTRGLHTGRNDDERAGHECAASSRTDVLASDNWSRHERLDRTATPVA